MSKISSTLTKGIAKYIPKSMGIAALGLTAYDAHIAGKIQSDVYAKSRDADACAKSFNNTQFLSSPSQTTAIMKDMVNRIEMENNFRNFVNSAIGYFKGFGLMLAENVVPFGLGIGALSGKGAIAKGSAIGLGVYSVIKLFKDVLGFGHSNDLNKKY